MMNLGSLTSYLTFCRLIPLSKQKGVDVVDVADIRPIVVSSRLSKIVEKALLVRPTQQHQHLISTGRYQTGFQHRRRTA